MLKKKRDGISKKKGLCIALSLLLLLVVSMVGCTETDDIQTETTTDEAQLETTSEVTDETVEEKVTLKILNHSWTFDPNDHPLTDNLEEITGYDLEFFTYPTDDTRDEKIMLELSSGIAYDIIKMHNPLFSKIAKQGSVLALDDLISEYGSNVMEAISPELWTEVTINGAIYGMPSKKDPACIYTATIVRKDILDEMEMDVPETLDEFTAVLEAFKEKEMIPYTSVGSISDTIISAFGVSNYWKEVDNTLVPRIKQAGIKGYLTYMSGLYADGLLDEELPANKADNKKEKFVSGDAGMMLMNWWDWQMLSSIPENLPDSEIEYILPLLGPSGEREVILQNANVSDKISVIPGSSEHPEDAMKFFNLFLDKENFKQIYIGTEGIHYEVVNGEIDPIMPAFSNDLANSWWYLVTTRTEDAKTYLSTFLKGEDPTQNSYKTFNNLLKGIEYAIGDPTNTLPIPDAVAKYKESLKTLEEEFFMKVIVGAESLDNFDDFIALWESEGGTEMEEAMNEEYNAAN